MDRHFPVELGYCMYWYVVQICKTLAKKVVRKLIVDAANFSATAQPISLLRKLRSMISGIKNHLLVYIITY